MRVSVLPVLLGGLVLPRIATADEPVWRDGLADEGGEDGQDEDDEEDSDWEKVGDEEDDDKWVKVEAPEPIEPPKIPTPSLQAVGFVTTGVGGVLLLRGIKLRAELKEEVTDLGSMPEEGWPADVSSLQERTNNHLVFGWVFVGAGTGMALVQPTAGTAVPWSLGWSTRW